MRRRRGARLEAALLEAAWAELTERGYATFTLEAVARRAATSTPVIYRRWANKHLMVEAALMYASSAQPLDTPDTGTLRGDLLAIMRAANETRLDLIAAMTAVLGTYFDETHTSPAQLRQQILAGEPSAADVIFQRAIDRGEACAERLTPRLRRLAFDLYRHEALTTLRPLPDDVIEEILDDIVLPLVRDA
ncbi:TetR/AcrR family transcriptional regulator C-terminal ligand-binding domain-containing protein [Nonomuraea sp. NPDC059023]|uniref:TetR/AcrR family transcriptional regulator n=1 Tax=unclassified Nonomuraea TaxID=2593643 RepID=UPI0036759C60